MPARTPALSDGGTFTEFDADRDSPHRPVLGAEMHVRERRFPSVTATIA